MAFNQVTNHLLREERVSGGPLSHLRAESDHRGVVTKKFFDVNNEVAETSSGARVMVRASGVRASAPRYSGR